MGDLKLLWMQFIVKKFLIADRYEPEIDLGLIPLIVSNDTKAMTM